MTVFKRFFCILLTVVILAGVFNTSALYSFAYESNDFEYEINEQTAVITKYTGSSPDIEIPEEIDGYAVTCIIGDAFSEISENITLTVPFSVALTDFSAEQTEKIIRITGYSSSPAFYFADENNIEFIALDKNGWITQNGNVYYYVNGVFLTGFQTLESENGITNKYYFGSDGAAKTGLTKILNNYYLFDSNGKMLTGFQSDGQDKYYFRPTGSVGKALKGIDVSTFQGNVNWAKVKKAGYEFAMIRGGYGKIAKTQKDAQFENNYKNAKLAGMPIGVYHYSYAQTVDDAKKEAAFCLSYLKGKKLECPIAYDVEDSSQSNLSKKALSAGQAVSSERN